MNLTIFHSNEIGSEYKLFFKLFEYKSLKNFRNTFNTLYVLNNNGIPLYLYLIMQIIDPQFLKIYNVKLLIYENTQYIPFDPRRLKYLHDLQSSKIPLKNLFEHDNNIDISKNAFSETLKAHSGKFSLEELEYFYLIGLLLINNSKPLRNTNGNTSIKVIKNGEIIHTKKKSYYHIKDTSLLLSKVSQIISICKIENIFIQDHIFLTNSNIKLTNYLLSIQVKYTFFSDIFDIPYMGAPILIIWNSNDPVRFKNPNYIELVV